MSAVLVLALSTLSLLACGGWFPNRLLRGGGYFMLTAPRASFATEIEVMELVRTVHTPVPDTGHHRLQSADAALEDLGRALGQRGDSEQQIEALLERHGTERKKVRLLAQQVEAARENVWPRPSSAESSPPVLPGSISVLGALPGEFADYFRGAIQWHAGNTNAAQMEWSKLLTRPESERRYRSTWAAFMLGKATWEKSPDQAVRYFQQTRSLATNGFADTLGLAASSLGWEGRVELRRKNYHRAITLYLEQCAGGDSGAYVSLDYAAVLAFRDSVRSLKELAENPRTQRVITAWIISEGLYGIDDYYGDRLAGERPVEKWLEAIEAVKAWDILSAEKFAVAAYQSGRMDIARRWIDRSPKSPSSRWLTAKLLLRDGRIDEAAAILSELTRSFPRVEPDEKSDNERRHFGERLRVPALDYPSDGWPVRFRQQVLGELGALRLARREFTQALDALLRTGYEEDAHYVAGRVLTIEELRTYVDRYWPELGGNAADLRIREGIRELLAHRLVRAEAFDEALAYFSSNHQKNFKDLLEKIREGRNAALPKARRAAALWTAARGLYASKLKFFTAPKETYWGLAHGKFYLSDHPTARMWPTTRLVVPISEEERGRVKSTNVYPKRDWYYRFRAADLAWEAARLMPDQSKETALVLWQAGTWIKLTDPKAADRFYKALVRRCRNTPLGREADRLRWFPKTAERVEKVSPLG